MSAALAAATLAGCGGGRPAPPPPSGSAPHLTTATTAALPAAATPAVHGAASAACSAAVMGVLGNVAQRIYNEAVASTTTRSAQQLVTGSSLLRRAVAGADAALAHRALRALLATGHMVRVRVLVAGRVLADAGSRVALGDVGGALGTAPGGAPARYELAVQSPAGLASATRGLTGGQVIVRVGHRLIGARVAPRSVRPGTVAGMGGRGSRSRLIVSFPARGFGGAPARVWLLRKRSDLGALCGRDRGQTRALAAGYVGTHIYNQEAHGFAALTQLRRAAASAPLTSAIARGDRGAVRAAIVSLLNQHIVRLRVLRGGQLLGDVGGPHVLAPVVGDLPGAGTRVRLVLSVQDDLGYQLLAQRLIGAEVVMRTGAQEVMGTLRPGPAQIPALGPVSWRGRRYDAFSFWGAAFPSGTLRISLLLPLA